MVQNILDTERAHVSELQVRFVCIQNCYFIYYYYLLLLFISLLVINWMGINLEKPLLKSTTSCVCLLLPLISINDTSSIFILPQALLQNYLKPLQTSNT